MTVLHGFKLTIRTTFEFEQVMRAVFQVRATVLNGTMPVSLLHRHRQSVVDCPAKGHLDSVVRWAFPVTRAVGSMGEVLASLLVTTTLSSHELSSAVLYHQFVLACIASEASFSTLNLCQCYSETALDGILDSTGHYPPFPQILLSCPWQLNNIERR